MKLETEPMAVMEKMIGTARRIYDAWGRAAPGVTARELSTRGEPDRLRDRQSLGSILAGVTPQRLAAIFAEADQGMIGTQIELAEDIYERDGHVSSLIEKARLAVTGLDWIVEAGDESEGSQEAATICREWLHEECLHHVIDRLLDAIIGQWAIERVIWNISEKREGKPYWYPESFEQIDARRLAWPQIDGEFVAVPGLMRNWISTDLEPITPGKFIAHGYRVNRSRPGKRALIRAIAAVWLVKRFALIDFAHLVEKWGIPFLVVKYAQGSSEADISAILTQLQKAGGNKVAAVPIGSDVATEASSAQISSLPQRELIRLCDEIMSKAIVGSTTMTDAAQSASGAASDSVSSPTHDKGFLLLRDARAKSVSAAINRDLLRPWFVWNAHLFAEEAMPPRLAPILTSDAADNLRFKRDVYKNFQTDGTVNDALANLTNMRELQRQVDVPIQENYEEPWFPVRDDHGNLLSGEVIKDSEGDIVGGGVIPGTAPVAAPGFGGQGPGSGFKGQEAEGEDPKPGEEKDSATEVTEGAE